MITHDLLSKGTKRDSCRKIQKNHQVLFYSVMLDIVDFVGSLKVDIWVYSWFSNSSACLEILLYSSCMANVSFFIAPCLSPVWRINHPFYDFSRHLPLYLGRFSYARMLAPLCTQHTVEKLLQLICLPASNWPSGLLDCPRIPPFDGSFMGRHRISPPWLHQGGAMEKTIQFFGDLCRHRVPFCGSNLDCSETSKT